MKAANRIPPCLRQEELEEILLGHQSYRMVKILRDISMTEKHRPDEHTESVVVQDPRNKVKAVLPEPQTPVMECSHPLLLSFPLVAKLVFAKPQYIIRCAVDNP
ncbi:hypothetical protein C5468_24400 [Photorhabdus luminescens subsp. mexicana]|uniref:Uncharacterized protein n=1 Tax=Photorhabdus luminescens subsp. mexicana TaxID=2100167 RepID=A0A4R4IR77_PHOLU|nr:hypothetical protein C5468_24400 [Photorhabdus luminescens subsp. mexicana]